MIAARSLWWHGFLSLVPVESVLRFWRWEVSVSDPLGWLALAGCVGGLIILCRLSSRSRSPLAAALWFVVGVSPILGVIDHHALGLSFAFSRHRYLSSIASIALVVGFRSMGGCKRTGRLSHKPRDGWLRWCLFWGV